MDDNLVLRIFFLKIQDDTRTFYNLEYQNQIMQVNVQQNWSDSENRRHLIKNEQNPA